MTLTPPVRPCERDPGRHPYRRSGHGPTFHESTTVERTRTGLLEPYTLPRPGLTPVLYRVEMSSSSTIVITGEVTYLLVRQCPRTNRSVVGTLNDGLTSTSFCSSPSHSLYR